MGSPANRADTREASRQTLVAVASSLCYLCIGLVRAWASTGLPSLNDHMNGTNPHIVDSAPLEESTCSWIVSLPPLAAIVGSSASSFSLSLLGRKFSIILAGIFFLVSFLIIGLASITSSVGMILAGRAISGLGVGLGVPSTSIYIAECSSARLRGKLSSMPAFMMAFGVLLGYVVGIFLPWHYLAYSCCAPAFILILSMTFLPESPSQLVRKGHHQRAEEVLKWLGRSHESSSSEAVKIVCQEKEDISEDKSGQKNSLLEFFQISNLHPLVLTCFIHFLQAWSGVNVIIFKTVSVFEVVGSSIDKYVCTAVVGGVQLFATGLSITLMDKAGRRPLLIISGLVMALSMGSLALFIMFVDSIPTSFRWMPLVSIIGSFIGYSLGFATIPFCIMGEILPFRTRNLSGALSSAFNLLCLFLVLQFYTSLASIMGYAGVYWLFSGISLGGVIFVIVLLPETRGKSLQQIEDIFKRK